MASWIPTENDLNLGRNFPNIHYCELSTSWPLRTLTVSFQHLQSLPKEFNSYDWQVTIWDGIKHPKMFVCNILLPCTQT